MSPLRSLLLLLALIAAPAAAQDFPPLSGRVVDAANIIPDADEAALTQKLEAVEKASSRQLVVATVPSLGGYPVEDYGYQLGRKWGIGQKGTNNGIILLVAPNDHKVRIEVGYGLEPIMTDALSSNIISEQILPRFKADDFPGGINAGADAIIAQLQAPPEQAERTALQAKERRARHSSGGGGSGLPLIFWGMVLAFVILRALIPGRRGRRYRRHGVWMWGPGIGSGWGSGWGGGSSGGGFGGFGGGGGGFSGGGGSFGGGGASGGW